MHAHSDLKGAVRRAGVNERQAVLEVINRAFGREGEERPDFLTDLPYLFRDERMDNHLVYEAGSKLLGVVGFYPYMVRLGGVAFRAAGIGQVGTLPAARGRGVMSALLCATCQAADACDFTWLWGDRQRYGRYGWATGGWNWRFTTNAKYLPPPPAASPRAVDLERDFDLIHAGLMAMPATVLMSAEELRLLLPARGIGGWVQDESFILLDRSGDVVIAAAGDAEAIAGLMAHQVQTRREEHGEYLDIECGPAPGALLRACFGHYCSARAQPSASLRVGDLAGFLAKACLVAQPRIDCGRGVVCLRNTDTGAAATVICEEGKLRVEPAPRAEAYALNTREMSEVCFGMGPLDLLLPGLEPAAPLRRILPLPAHIPHLFSL